MAYSIPKIPTPKPAKPNTAYLIANGDLRLSANQVCWPAQHEMEQRVIAAFANEGIKVIRAHEYDPELKHGFIWNQRMGVDVFQSIPPEAPLIVAEAVWQYSYHILPGLRDHRGPILTVANWSGQWPGLVGMLNLNGSLTKMGVKYSTIWSENFDDPFFLKGIRQWIRTGRIKHDTSHVRALDLDKLPAAERKLGLALAEHLKRRKAIIGVFDEGCMGMYNAIIDDELLNPTGIYKERLSQSALVAEMRRVPDHEADEARRWLEARGMKFKTGTDEATELTDNQIREQLKMYIAAVRIADAFSCDAIGIQYQQGLKDMTPASDLAEGLLNNAERPPVYREGTNVELYAGQPLPHFNEVDEGAAVDALVTNRVWTAMGFDPATTLHDLRYGEHYKDDKVDDFVWVFEISGAAPASHFIGGYAGAVSERQPPMYFRLGGGTLKGISKPGEIVWSRVFVEGGKLHADLGRATVVELPLEETERRWQMTTPQWPIMHAVLHGVSRDQMMARHKSNHIQVAYAPDAKAADKALAAKAAMFAGMGIQVHLCGKVKVG
ncbi:MAG: fucose isomerase [Anaerolineae bacterium]|nr:fucose isomerase [Anaerolineae bacterium]